MFRVLNVLNALREKKMRLFGWQQITNSAFMNDLSEQDVWIVLEVSFD